MSRRLSEKGFEPGAVREAIEKLKGFGYVDDIALAHSLKRRALEQKLLGSAGAMRYIRQMGIPKDAAIEALSGYEETEAASRLVEKKMRTMKAGPPDVVRRRLAGCLQRRGYSSDTVRKALTNIKNNGEER